MLRPPPPRRLRRPRGFTLLELIITVAVASIMVAVMAPAMTNIGARETLAAEAFSIGQKIVAMREAAIEDGLCYAARVNPSTNSRWNAFRMPERTCTGTFTGTGDALGMGSGTGGAGVRVVELSHELPAGLRRYTLAETNNLVWLPNGWLRGDNLSSPSADVSGTADRYTLTITDPRLPVGSNVVRIVVNAAGLVCVNTNGGASCP